MNYRDYIKEVTIDTNPELQNFFNLAIKQVFSPQYLQKIDKILKRSILIKEKGERPGIVAFNDGGSTIFVNPDEFYRRDKKQQIKYILHELIHILQRKRGLIFRRFKEMKKVTNKLNVTLSKHLKKHLSVFLTGKKQELGAGAKWEILSYFMNDSINWEAITPEGKEAMIKILRDSKVFNVDHPFWKKRLS